MHARKSDNATARITTYTAMREFLANYWTLIAVFILLSLVRNPDEFKGDRGLWVGTAIAFVCVFLLAIGWHRLGKSQISRYLRWFVLLPVLLVVFLSGVLFPVLIISMAYIALDLFVFSKRRK
jgi:hypothetical protein